MTVITQMTWLSWLEWKPVACFNFQLKRHWFFFHNEMIAWTKMSRLAELKTGISQRISSSILWSCAHFIPADRDNSPNLINIKKKKCEEMLCAWPYYDVIMNSLEILGSNLANSSFIQWLYMNKCILCHLVLLFRFCIFIIGVKC